MSEYQYYEFQAVDRPLTESEMAELRALTTRATITPTRLQNVYHWGDFKGDPLVLMERYFDAFVYVANWGTHEFMLRLPRRLLDPEAVEPYAVDEVLSVHDTGDCVILAFRSEDEGGGGWVEDEEADSWMPALLPLRAELASGDQRLLYLAWLAGAQAGMLDEAEIETPVPPGLGTVSASLAALAAFMRIDSDLLAVAAEGSTRLPAPPAEALDRWITNLPASEKDDLLLQFARGEDVHLRAELLRRFQQTHAVRTEAGAGARTVGELLSAAETRVEARRRQQAERAAAEQARRAQEEAAARAAYLDSLAGREEDLWCQIDRLVETKQPKDYDRAVQLATDLRDLSHRLQQDAAFAARLAALREQCAKRPSLIGRLDRAGLDV